MKTLVQFLNDLFLLIASGRRQTNDRNPVFTQNTVFLHVTSTLDLIHGVITVAVGFNHKNRLVADFIRDQEVHVRKRRERILGFLIRQQIGIPQLTLKGEVSEYIQVTELILGLHNVL